MERGSEGSEEGAREKGREGVEEIEGEERGGEGDRKYEYSEVMADYSSQEQTPNFITRASNFFSLLVQVVSIFIASL